jgi:hypothetical protein
MAAAAETFLPAVLQLQYPGDWPGGEGSSLGQVVPATLARALIQPVCDVSFGWIAMKRVVGLYICCVAIGQLALYSIVHFNRDAMWLSYFDPRIGLAAFQGLFLHGTRYPAYLSWLSAMVLAVVGIGLIRNVYGITLYLFAEALFTLPTLMFFAMVLISNMSPAHGFSVGELVWPSLMFVVCSAIPYWLGLKARQRDDAA